MKLALVASIAVSTISMAMHGGQSFQESLQKARVSRNTSLESKIQLLHQATGNIRLFDADPVKISQQNNQSVAQVQKATQVGCSAVYIQTVPPVFITSSDCFGKGKVSDFREYGKIFVQGQGWTIDPTSIVSPAVVEETDKKNTRLYDVAVFSLIQTEEDSFARTHKPIPLVDLNSYLLEGQLSTFVGFGAKSSQSKDFGEFQLKDFLYSEPTVEERTQANTKLAPEHGLLTYATADGELGINCDGDSGGGVFTEMDSILGSTLVLQGLILGKTGRDGNGKIECEKTSGYAVVLDLRELGGGIQRAVQKLGEQRKEALDHISKYYQLANSFFRPSNPPPHWAPIRSEKGRAFDEATTTLNVPEKLLLLESMLRLEAKKREARATLVGNSNASMDGQVLPYNRGVTNLNIQNSWQLPESQYQQFTLHDKGKGHQQAWPTGSNRLFYFLKVRNPTDKTIKLTNTRLLTSNGTNTFDDKVLKPGESVDYRIKDEVVLQFSDFYYDCTETTKLEVWGRYLTQPEKQAMKAQELARWNAYYDAQISRINARAEQLKALVPDRFDFFAMSNYNRTVDAHNDELHNFQSANRRVIYNLDQKYGN